MEDLIGQLESSIQATVSSDADFQKTLEGLADDEKNQKILAKKSELLNKELLSLKEGSDRAKKAQELAENYKSRAEKAEAALKGKDSSSSTQDQYSPQEIIALGKLHEDDVETVQNWARFKNAKVHEALKDKDLQLILNARTEERKTAAAAQVNGGQRGGNNATHQQILDKASKGQLPEDEDAIAKLAEARMASKLKK